MSAIFSWSQLQDRCLFVGEYEWCHRGEDAPEPPKPRGPARASVTSPEREKANARQRIKYAKAKAWREMTLAQREHIKAYRRERYKNKREEIIAKQLEWYHNKKNSRNG